MIKDKQSSAKPKVIYWSIMFLLLILLIIASLFGREEITTVYGQSNLGKATTERYVLFVPFTTDPKNSEYFIDNSEYFSDKIILSGTTAKKTTLLEDDYSQLLAPIKNARKLILEYDAYYMFGLLRAYKKHPDNMSIISGIAKRYAESDSFRARLRSMLEKKELSADFFLHAVRVDNLLALELVMSGRYTEAEVLKRPSLDNPWNDYEPGL